MKYIIISLLNLAFFWLLFEAFPYDNEAALLTLILPIFVLAGSLLVPWLLYRFVPNRALAHTLSIVLTLFITYYFFPSATNNSPVDIVQRMVQVKKNYQAVHYNDMLQPYEPANYEKIVAARRKFVQEVVPDKYYGVIYKDKKSFPVKEFVLYFRNDTLYTTNNALSIARYNDQYICEERVNEDTVQFMIAGNSRSPVSFRRDLQDAPFKSLTHEYRFVKVTIKDAAPPEDHYPDHRYWAYAVFFRLL